MALPQPHKIIDGPLTLGEGPLWDERTATLYFVDILERKLFIYSRGLERFDVHDFNEFISCVALSPSPQELLVALESGIYRYDIENKRLRFQIQPEQKANYRFNDGRVDPQGNWLLGSMNNINNGPGATHQPDASLFRIAGREANILLDGVTISNGLVFWDGCVYFIDSILGNVRRFSYHNDALRFEEAIFTISDGTSLDGMTVSTVGKLYIANWGGGKIIVFDLLLREVVGEIPLPCKNPTSCTFGGRNLDELYMTTSVLGDETNRHAGAVYMVKLNENGYVENKVGW